MKLAATGRILRDYLRWLRGRASSRLQSQAVCPIARITRDEHRAKLRTLRDSLQSAIPPLRTFRNRVGHTTRISSRFHGSWLDISSFDGVVEFDAQQRSVIVEPLVTMETLLLLTAPRRLRPAVVPEFSQMTVGGSIQGVAAESSSHREGLFHESVEWMELLFPDGRVEVINPRDHASLFRDLPGSYGTLAIITLVKLRLVEMSPFVELRYEHTDVGGFVRAVRDSSQWQFLDAICFQEERCVVMRGRDAVLPQDPLYVPKHFSPWFDEHVQSHLEGACEWLPTLDYLFRYDRGAFFVGSSKLGSSWLSRAAFGSYASTANLYRLRGLSPESSTRIVQDVAIPIAQFETFVRRLRTEVLTSRGPLWFCPMRQKSDLLFGPPGETFINVGIYNRSGEKPGAFLALNRSIEQLTREHGGFKALYAANYYSEEEFWSIYDRSAYERARKHCGADGRFEDIFQKLSQTPSR